jgi:hypothetical protein
MPCYSFGTKLLCFQLLGSRNRIFDFVVGGWQFMSGYFSQSYKNVEYLMVGRGEIFYVKKKLFFQSGFLFAASRSWRFKLRGGFL